METFATNAEFRRAINAALCSSSTEDTVRAALVAGIDQGETEQRSVARNADGALNLRVSNWVLRGQDMPVLELIAIVGAAATAAVVPGGIAAGAMVTALTSFASLCWKTWRKGAPLSKAEIAVLGFVEVHGPISIEDLRAKASVVLDLTISDIDNAVLTLQQVEMRDGDIVPLIRQDAAGQWRTRTA
jgi:hypothetical protein